MCCKQLLRIVPLSFICMTFSLYAVDKAVYGLHEYVKLMDLNEIKVKAKMDTGARTTSLGVTNIHKFSKNGESWVRFTPQIKGKKDLPEISLPIVRHSKIKRRQSDTNNDKDALTIQRPVVMMNLCINGQIYPTEVNLADRSRFIYPLLIGATALITYQAIVDPSLKYQTKPNC